MVWGVEVTSVDYDISKCKNIIKVLFVCHGRKAVCGHKLA